MPLTQFQKKKFKNEIFRNFKIFQGIGPKKSIMEKILSISNPGIQLIYGREKDVRTI